MAASGNGLKKVNHETGAKIHYEYSGFYEVTLYIVFSLHAVL